MYTFSKRLVDQRHFKSRDLQFFTMPTTFSVSWRFLIKMIRAVFHRIIWVGKYLYDHLVQTSTHHPFPLNHTPHCSSYQSRIQSIPNDFQVDENLIGFCLCSWWCHMICNWIIFNRLFSVLTWMWAGVACWCF